MGIAVNNNNLMSRREFLRITGAGITANTSYGRAVLSVLAANATRIVSHKAVIGKLVKLGYSPEIALVAFKLARVQ